MKKRMSWTEGWHETSKYFAYFVKDGKIDRGMSRGRSGEWVTVYPYIDSPCGGLDIERSLKACKRNFERLTFR